MSSKFEIHFFKLLSLATLNLVLTLLFLFQSLTVVSWRIKFLRTVFYTRLNLFCSPQPTVDFTGTTSISKLPSNDLRVPVPAPVFCYYRLRLFSTFYRLHLQHFMWVRVSTTNAIEFLTSSALTSSANIVFNIFLSFFSNVTLTFRLMFIFLIALFMLY